MAIIIRGKVYSSWKEAESYSSIFRREQQKFHGKIDAGGCPPSAPDRYWLIAGYGDPWSHRVLIVRALKKLVRAIPLVMVDPNPTKLGWMLLKQDGLLDYEYLHQIYTSYDAAYTGRISVPLLWDHENKTIVNNESNEILRIFNDSFAHLSPETLDLYPLDKQEKINHLVNFIFDNINNGVYKVGFAPTQSVYEKSSAALFAALDDMEERLSTSRYLLGDEITGADVCLFATLIRFDTIYYPYLRCNHKRLQDYTNLWLYTKDIYHLPGVKETVKPEAMMKTYYGLEYLNPSQVIPTPPTIDFGSGVEVLTYELYSAPF